MKQVNAPSRSSGRTRAVCAVPAHVQTGLENHPVEGIAIFVTEWGTSDASGNGGPYLTEAQGWLDFLAARKISWANWSLSDKNETARRELYRRLARTT
ncbi:cellulase family glycosylhydrolase [Cohnella nanjingensis]|uniref:cellulase family glycosylhydrolase n=1 Tax=Cohnella nanjingensis TaxID=1387779 RepID=UPI0035E4085B